MLFFETRFSSYLQTSDGICSRLSLQVDKVLDQEFGHLVYWMTLNNEDHHSSNFCLSLEKWLNQLSLKLKIKYFFARNVEMMHKNCQR